MATIYDVHKQRIREMFIKIELLDFNENVVGALEGVCTGGSVDIDADSSIQRNCSLEIVIKDGSYLPSEVSKIWLNKKFILYTGIKDITNDEIVYIKQGIFFMSNPQIESGNGVRKLTLKGYDKMCWLNGQLSGSLNYTTIRPKDTTFYDAIKTTLEINGETKFIISDVEGLVLPYQIEKTATDNITSILEEIRDLYMFFEFYYDVNGYFTFRKIKDRKNDIVKHNFEENNLIVNYSNAPNWENIRNDFYVYGRVLTDGTKIQYHLENNDINSPFNIDKIGKRTLIPIVDETIFTQEQAQIRCEYEMFKHSNLNEQISVSLPPIYNMQSNDVCQLKDSESGIEGRYLVKKFNIPLDESLSTVTLQKLYYEV